jgi:hypothetical protein
MSLSPPEARTPVHHRRIDCTGYRRDDGLWDIEARLVDTKTYDFANHDRGGSIRAGEPLHEMALRVTIDTDFLIHRVEAVTDHGPFRVCGAIAPSFSELAGLRIGKGFLGEVRRRLGGVKGCTHLVELFGPLATTAYQTLYPAREAKAQAEPQRDRPRIIDTCHALSASGEVVARLWPDFYDPAAEPASSGDSVSSDSACTRSRSSSASAS